MMSVSIAAKDYEYIRRLVYEQSRINLGPAKRELVHCRVQKRLRALGLTDFSAYCRLLDSPAGEKEVPALVDVISTNVTEFFREWHHFEFLRGVVLPARERCANRRPGKAFRVWSAACSSGEEPYSIAIILAEFFGIAPSCGWCITATDISNRMLAAAQQAIYRSGRLLKLPQPDWLRRWFQKGSGAWEDYFRVKSCLRHRVDFSRLDLTRSPYPFPEKFDAIFCRNVMIYFDRETQEQLVPRLVEQLAPGGYLFVGHSESFVGIKHGLKPVRPSIYRRE